MLAFRGGIDVFKASSLRVFGLRFTATWRGRGSRAAGKLADSDVGDVNQHGHKSYVG